MSLGDFIARLDAAHLDVDAAQVLDALWLANLGRDLSLHETPALSPSPSAPIPAEAPDGDRQGRNTEKPKNTDVTPPPALQRLKRPRNVDVFPAIEAPQSRGTLPASPVALPAPRALANRLALMRALRPLSQRWRSHQYAEVDEELTAESCFRVGTNKARLMLPAFKPRRERWFDVELVVEDEPSAQLWDPMLREFAGLLRETGAFGSVRQWRLCVDSKEAAAHLENGLGIRVATGSLLGKAARRLVIVATTGASSRWADGSIAKVVSPWTHDNSVVLLQLTAPERWARSSLGEPQAFAWTTTPGAAAAALKVQTHWWKITRDWNVSVVLPLPVITLTPAALGQWASMQMARGRANPAYLLNNANPDSVSIDRTAAQLDFSRVVALLKYESSEIFQLAVFLSTGVFTLTVAQLVQAIKFGGNADPGMLAELLRCGLVIPVAPNSGAGGTAFSVHPQARELLQRSLRDSEAVRLAHDVQVQISLQISNFVGSGVRSSQLIADEDGQHQDRKSVV